MELKHVVPWGRSFDEYRKIFSLSEADLNKYILGCGDGPASFNAELSARGGKIVSADPSYQFTVSQLKSRISDVYDEIMPQAQLNKDNYCWESIPSIEALGEIRMSAMNTFLADYENGKAQGRYIEASLPTLPFNDKQFDLALCSHYLFLYSEQVSFDQHLQAMIELCRVSTEVRVYPLIALNGQQSPHINEIKSALTNLGHRVSLAEVDYQFQKGATHMLVVTSA